MEHEELLPLLIKVARKDSRAFEALYTATKRQMFAVALQLLKNTESAEEAVQEAFISIWYKADQYREGTGTVFTWMVSIVRYRSLDMLRYKKVRKEDALDESVVEAMLDENEVASVPTQQLNNCMGELDSQQRQAIHLAYFNGYSHSEVVEHLASPLGTVKSWIRRGLQSLQRCLSI